MDCKGGISDRIFFTLNRGSPLNWPPLSLMRPLSSKTLMNSRLWRLPVAKSLGSCAGVTWGRKVGPR